MKKLLAAAAVAIALIVSAAFTPAYDLTTRDHSDATVIVEVNGGLGHGSGVHIGGGYILTAAHVPDGEDNIAVRDEQGRKKAAVVVGFDKAHDVALLYAKGFQGATAELSCSAVKLGQTIQIVGNPFDIEFIHTWGRVGGLTRKVGNWQEAFVGDIVAGPGNSGGPVFGARGRVVGLLVGGYRGLAGWAFIVPSSTICRLMGRV